MLLLISMIMNYCCILFEFCLLFTLNFLNFLTVLLYFFLHQIILNGIKFTLLKKL